MNAWNTPQTTAPVHQGLHVLFEAQAQQRPELTAVEDAGTSLSYAELNSRANQQAHRLRQLGVKPNTLVGLCVDRSLDMVVALLGILKAGGAYVPLDPTYPQNRLQFMLADAQVPVLITQAHLRERLPEYAGQMLIIDEERPSLDTLPATNLESDITGASLAYVIYTSGSTGRPKGVCLPHRALTNLLTWHMATLIGGARTLQFASLSFDASIHEMFAAWASGGTLVLVPEPLRQDLARLAHFLVEQRLEKVILPVAVLQQLSEIYLNGGSTPATLREVITTGEQLRITDAVRALFERLPQCSLHNHYGPSETHVVTAYTLAGSPVAWPTRPPIGSPITNTQLYVLDPQMQLVPGGEPGELYIGGMSLADGYLNRPELTVERFIPNPFTTTDDRRLTTDDGTAASGGRWSVVDGRLYKTGDLVRKLPDGELEFIERIDHQVKVRGFRVEPGEIESVLERHPDVRSAVVVPQAAPSGEQRLVAYVVPSVERSPTIGGRKRHVLPNGMALAYINVSEADALYDVIFAERRYSQYGLSIEDGACVFDVGGNMGMFTVFAAQEANDVQVYAFEPNPTMSEILRLNAQLYGSNAIVYDKGLGDAEKIAPFSFYREVSTFSGFYAEPTEEAKNYRQLVTNLADQQAIQSLDSVMSGRFKAETILCQLTTVSQVVREHNLHRIDYLKINVEKSELDVLAGIGAEDWPKIQKLFVEVHETSGQVEQVKRLLEEQGFQVAVDQAGTFQQTNIFQLYGTRPGANGSPKPAGTPARSYKPPITIDDLRRFLAEQLPDHMIPAAYVFLETLPLTPNGKVDLRALPAPTTARPNLTSPMVHPRTPLERTLATLWSEVLGIEEIGAEDNFFQLGGHSLLGTQVLSRVHQIFGVELILHDLFDHPTISRLAQHIDSSRAFTMISSQDASGAKREEIDL
jgi:amino acid adenylation domain-containing protein/FkbM family methyltransferase